VAHRGTGRPDWEKGWARHDLTGFGELLQQARAYKGASLREAEKETRIPRRHLAALEQEEFHQLPPLIYARGIVRNYAQYLGLDPVATLARFEQSHGQKSGGFRVVPAVKTVDVPSHWAPNFAIIAFMVVMSAVIFAWMYSAYFAPANGTPTEQAAATPTVDQDVAVIEQTPTPGLRDGGGEALSTPEPEPTPEPTPEPEPTEPPPPEPEEPEVTTNQFTIVTTERVWLQVRVDGELVLEEILAAGSSVSFEGDEMVVTSGNAAFVRVSVNGEDTGTLGETWDAVTTYP
jgi:cytoskeleton protein RodZ